MALFLRTSRAVDRPRAGGQRLVVACLADAVDDLLAAEFFRS